MPGQTSPLYRKLDDGIYDIEVVPAERAKPGYVSVVAKR
jgi:hypothetical protein